MTNRYEQPSPEPLPIEVEPGLRRLDEQIARISDGAVDVELIERVYAASVGHLGGRSRLRLVSAGSRRARRSVSTGRLAMAASVALATGIGLWTLRQSTTPAALPPIAEAAGLEYLDAVLADTSGVDTVLELTGLEERWDLYSADEFSGELAMLAANLEM